MCALSASDMVQRCWHVDPAVGCEDLTSRRVACLLVILPCLQALGYLPPQLPSPINSANEQKMTAIAKVLGNSSKHDSGSMLHGRVMVFSGQLSDNSPAIAKIPAEAVLLQQEVGVLHVLCGR